MAARATTEQKPDSGTQKYVKKLENELRGYKQRDGTVSFSSKKVEIGKYGEKGEKNMFLVVSGESGEKSSVMLAIHRVRGQDYKVPPESWCVSEVENIPQFDSSKDHPAKTKIMANLTTIKKDFALDNLSDEGGVKFANYYEDFRSGQLDSSKSRRSAYQAVRGKSPHSVCFLDSVEYSKLETKFLNVTIEETAVMPECKALHVEEMMHRPKTMSQVSQVSAKYLYGIDSKNVMRAFYHHVRGMTSDIPVTDFPTDYPVLEVSIPSLDDIDWSNTESMALNNLLDEHSKLLKNRNVLNAEKTALEKKGTKEQKATAKTNIRENEAAITTSSDLVKAADIEFAETLYNVPKYTLVMRSDVDAEINRLSTRTGNN